MCFSSDQMEFVCWDTLKQDQLLFLCPTHSISSSHGHKPRTWFHVGHDCFPNAFRTFEFSERSSLMVWWCLLISYGSTSRGLGSELWGQRSARKGFKAHLKNAHLHVGTEQDTKQVFHSRNLWRRMRSKDLFLFISPYSSFPLAFLTLLCLAVCFVWTPNDKQYPITNFNKVNFECWTMKALPGSKTSFSWS